MELIVEVPSTDDRRRTTPQHPFCAVDGAPLFDTIVGPRCPICGTAGLG